MLAVRQLDDPCRRAISYAKNSHRYALAAVLAFTTSCSQASDSLPTATESVRQSSLTAGGAEVLSAVVGDTIVVATGSILTVRPRTVAVPSQRSRRLKADGPVWRLADSRLGTIAASGTSAVVAAASTPGRTSLEQVTDGFVRATSVFQTLTAANVAATSIQLNADTVMMGTILRPVLEVLTADGVRVRTRVGAWTVIGAGATIQPDGGIAVASAGNVRIGVDALGRSATRTLAVMSVPTVGTISMLAASIQVGASSTADARFVDGNGVAGYCKLVTWQATSVTGAITVRPQLNTLSALVTGTAVGIATLTARCDGQIVANQSVSVTGASNDGPGFTPPSSLAMKLVRIVPSTAGSLFVSSGIPLRKGTLGSGDVSKIRLLVGGVEIPRYAAALQGTHPDGSLRSVLLQFTVPASAIGQVVSIEFSGSTTAALNGVTPPSIPSTIITYASENEFIRSGIVGPTRTQLETPNTPAYFRQYDANWARVEPLQVQRNDVIAIQNLYDRVLAYFAYYARTGNPEYYLKGATLAKRYRDEYMKPNDYGLPEWQANYDGIAAHYWLTGDEESRTAILYSAGSLSHARGGDQLANWTSHGWMDNRVQARVFGSKVLSLMLGATSISGLGWNRPIPNLRASADSDLTRILSTQQTDGAYRFAITCGQSSNFMSGLLNGVLGQYYEQITPDPKVLNSVRKSYQWLLSTQWVGSVRLFQYYSGTCVPYGNAAVAADLNGLFLDGLAFLYRQTNDASLLATGDEIFRGGVESTFIDSPKQFNEWYQMSWRWLGARAPLPQ
jgi:hypothetical protein